MPVDFLEVIEGLAVTAQSLVTAYYLNGGERLAGH